MCLSDVRALIAPAGGAHAARAVAGTSSEASPQCVYSAGRLTVTVIVDTGAQPYFRLERAIVEDSQQFGTVRIEPAPEHVPGLGLDASWFPGEQHLMTTDGRRLLTVQVSGRGTSQSQRRTLATAVAALYLHRG